MPQVPGVRPFDEGDLADQEELIPNSRHKTVLHLRHEDELFIFVNAHEQRIKPVATGNVTTYDEFLLSVYAMLDPRA